MNGKAFAKSTILLLFLVASSIFFGWVCREMQANYTGIFRFDRNFLFLLLWMAIAAMLMIIFMGLVAAFVRSRWVAVLYAFISAACILLTWGFSWLALAGCALYFGLAVFFILEVSGHMRNQIVFSMGAVTSHQTLVQTGLIVMLAVSFILGIQGDMVASDSVLPVEIKDSVLDIAAPIMQTNLEQFDITGQFTDAISSVAQSTLDQVWTQIEKVLKPIVTIIPYLGGILIFGLLQIIFMLISRLLLVPERLLIGFLRGIRFIREEKQLKEVTELTL